MKTINYSLIIIAACLLMHGQSCINGKNYGPQVKESRKISGFDAIEVSHGIDVYLTMGSKENIEVEAPEELIKELVTEIKGSKLKIFFDRSINWNNDATVYVNAKKINKISVSGGSDLLGKNKLKAKNLHLEASGGSDLSLEIDVKNLDIKTSGGSDIELSGFTEFLEVSSSGGSDLKAFDLNSRTADLEASGGSDIKITVEDELEARASGGADIEYKGNPQRVNVNAATSSDIRRIE